MTVWATEFGDSSLGKFASEGSLKKILSNGSLLWKRPQEFNDPFDCQPRFRLPEASFELEEATRREFNRVVAGEIYSMSISTGLGKALSLLAQDVEAKKLSLDDAWLNFQPGIAEILSSKSDFCGRYHKHVVLSFQTVKVLCLTKAFDEILMWSHYADNHTGALLVFAPKSVDSQFLIAKPVEYLEYFPLLLENDRLAQLITGQISMGEGESLSEQMDRITLTKALAWEYEQEWRIVGGEGFKPEISCEANPFYPEDVKAVVFGTRFDPKSMGEILKLERPRYPKTKWYRARTSDTRFGLDLESIT